MTPMKLVNLWRQRWGVGGRFLPTQEFARFYVSDTVQEYVVGDVSRYGGPASILLGIAGFLMFVATTMVQQTIFDQLFFAGAMILIALGVRRLRGRMAFLIVSGIAVLMGARYLWWRVSFTIQPDYDGIPGTLLFIAELFLMAAFAVHMLVSAFPFIIQPAPQRPISEDDPYLDVILAVPGGIRPTKEQILEWIHVIRTQQWPPERVRFFIATDSASDYAVIRSAGATPMVHGGPVSERTSDGFHLSVPPGNGKFVFVLSTRFVSGMESHTRIVRSWIEWMERDPKLAAIHTNAQRYMPPNSEVVRNVMFSSAEEYLMVRRTSWERLPEGSPITAYALEATGAHIATAGHPRDPGDESSLESQMTDWIRIDTSVPQKALRLRSRLNTLDEILRAGAPTAWLIVFFAIIGIALFSYYPVNAPLTAYLAYLVPFMLLVILGYNRAHGPLFRPLKQEVRDVWLSLILPPLVTFNMVRLSIRALLFGETPRPQMPRPEEWVALLLLLSVPVAAIWRWPWVEGLYRPWLIGAVLVALYLTQTLATRWAIRNERDFLAQRVQGMRRQPVAIRFPDGRLFRGSALNFPTVPLRLELIADPEFANQYVECAVIFPESPEQSSFAGVLQPQSASGLRKFAPEVAAITKYHRFAWHSQWEIVRRVQWLPPPRLGTWLLSNLGLQRFVPNHLKSTISYRTPARR